MKSIFTLLLCLFLFACQNVKNSDTTDQINDSNGTGIEISFKTSDSLTVYGDLHLIKKTNPTILLFHQGGSNARAEYAAIISKLTKKGFNVLAIDQRTGGQLYGKYNRTMVDIYASPYGYCDAYPDLEAALHYIETMEYTGKKILWGSSYSASLAIKLAHANQDKIAAVLAFSPASGGPMLECRPDEYFESLEVPLLVLRPAQELERESSKEQFELVKSHGHQVYKALKGVHGSSMLVSERVGSEVDSNWEVVLKFLMQV